MMVKGEKVDEFVYTAKIKGNMNFVYPSKTEQKANFIYYVRQNRKIWKEICNGKTK